MKGICFHPNLIIIPFTQIFVFLQEKAIISQENVRSKIVLSEPSIISVLLNNPSPTPNTAILFL